MRRGTVAGFVYGAAAFALGFLFGVIRVSLVTPRIGPLWAVLVEVPVMLVLLWPLARRIASHWLVAVAFAPRLAMGTAALATLLTAEVALGMIGFNQGLDDVVGRLASPEGLFGLAGQIAFASFPCWQMRRAMDCRAPSATLCAHRKQGSGLV
ncbi:MAG TPA: hypothetical protein PLQ11_00860 [Beijerinckiaceae bacterium]|nr:hypothetical protein [Beijerinckiaceae bacterium]